MARFFSRVAYKGTAEWKEEIVYLDPEATEPLRAIFLENLHEALLEEARGCQDRDIQAVGLTAGASAPADLIVLNHYQKTPLTTDTWLNHLLFDFHPWDIDAVYVGGRRVYLSGDAPPVEPRLLQETAARIWKNMGLKS